MQSTAETIEMLLVETDKRIKELNDEISLRKLQLLNCRQIQRSLLKQKEEIKHATCVNY